MIAAAQRAGKSAEESAQLGGVFAALALAQEELALREDVLPVGGAPHGIDVVERDLLAAVDGHRRPDHDLAPSGERSRGVGHAVVFEETGRCVDALLVERQLETVDEDDAAQFDDQVVGRLQFQRFAHKPVKIKITPTLTVELKELES